MRSRSDHSCSRSRRRHRDAARLGRHPHVPPARSARSLSPRSARPGSRRRSLRSHRRRRRTVRTDACHRRRLPARAPSSRAHRHHPRGSEGRRRTQPHLALECGPTRHCRSAPALHRDVRRTRTSGRTKRRLASCARRHHCLHRRRLCAVPRLVARRTQRARPRRLRRRWPGDRARSRPRRPMHSTCSPRSSDRGSSPRTASIAAARSSGSAASTSASGYPGARISDLYFTLLECGHSLSRATGAVVVHPVREPSWGVSVREQRKSMYNALLYKKHPRLYRQRVQARPPLRYYAILGVLAIGCVGIMSRRASPSAGRCRHLGSHDAGIRRRATARDIARAVPRCRDARRPPPSSRRCRSAGGCAAPGSSACRSSNRRQANLSRKWLAAARTAGHRGRMDLPSYLQIEPVGQCNLRCQMCPIQFRRDGPPYGAPAFMKFETYTRLIDECSNLDASPPAGPRRADDAPTLLRHGRLRRRARSPRSRTNSNLTLLNAQRASAMRAERPRGPARLHRWRDGGDVRAHPRPRPLRPRPGATSTAS